MNPERYEILGRERIVHGDLFDHPNVVVPIKTGGRWYGSISRAVASLAELPKLTLCESKVVHRGDGRNFVFVALWNDSTPYSPQHIRDCTRSAILAAAHASLETLAMPLLGGTEGYRYIGSMEQAIQSMEDTLESSEMTPPEVVLVVR